MDKEPIDMVGSVVHVMQGHVEIIRSLVTDGVVETKPTQSMAGLKDTLFQIEDICDWLEKCALAIKKYVEMKCEEALETLDTSTVEDHEALAEMLAIPSPERIPPWLHFEENGIEYDSDQ
ncbi:hypothetical protein GUJ93_ZPchr0004g38435 [Zizania palustris]|uniref:Uncharacterized protein n=1 Tax=Zizania palustris TaxID=103762 RepID=A0A8J5RYY5_ZIZPA|nr:hypothetical protein GUJ93_ZPchr0004g38435 [Zizania palustris]